ncbi:XkdQ/YqbQ family protein [Gorillibacterium sp. sgz5001074]|uniref:XkdQ/YqbQ family protein n=1 Tax=Gorillibacterium sp. sgz5001074 TaxID=3446695 RepID=UPI003F667E0D
MLKVMIDNKNGNVWDISDLVESASWVTGRIGKAGKLDFTYVKGGLYQSASFVVQMGDIVRVSKDGVNVFYGYVFTVSSDMSESVRVVAYDQLRYLMTNDSYYFQNETASDIIRRIAQDSGLKLGSIAETDYRIPSQMEDGKKLFDMICTALDKTLVATGKLYVLYDDFGSLCLRESQNMIAQVMIGDGSLMTGYEYEESIDQDTYNRIKLVRDNKETNRREVYIAQDSGKMAAWGRLQYFEKVDEGLPQAQIAERLNNLLFLKNRKTKQLRIPALGDIQVRAGCYVYISIEEYGIQQYYLVDECTHRFDGQEHTMTLEVKVVE